MEGSERKDATGATEEKRTEEKALYRESTFCCIRAAPISGQRIGWRRSISISDLLTPPGCAEVSCRWPRMTRGESSPHQNRTPRAPAARPPIVTRRVRRQVTPPTGGAPIAGWAEPMSPSRSGDERRRVAALGFEHTRRAAAVNLPVRDGGLAEFGRLTAAYARPVARDARRHAPHDRLEADHDNRGCDICSPSDAYRRLSDRPFRRPVRLAVPGLDRWRPANRTAP
jgi:hypothetical protein